MTDAIRIKTEPDPFEAFRIAQGYKVGDLILMSGQASIDSAGNIVGVGDFDAQAEQTFQNIKSVLHAAGSDIDRIVKVVIYLTDISNFQKILELREKWFTPPYPADTIVEVSSLALPELMIEIDVTALANGEIINT
ncbi:MAG: RidA family protein [Rhodospirillaceae bacterium]|nr:RidA family protein [Rhodospirillaceae bacterium]